MTARSQYQGGAPAARTMLLILASLALATAAPATYDQRQEGEVNVQADVQNVVFLVAIPQKIPNSLLDLSWLKSAKQNPSDEIQERADVHVMEAFVEPSEPYRVEIGSEGVRRAEADGRNADADADVVIAGRRRLETDAPEKVEYQLIGATEQCGPDRERDPVTLVCRSRSQVSPSDAPEVIPVPS
ncbi:uncharacterized protein LOC123691160 [Colias croceus]|uniref:uncharacterized protein LOC123691160 n=1 Tax=Colias crocea TaxID=72248 RepID=UPI001E281594|nr:uncharacterized protein LOC123691160 [Colias croceus]